MLRFKILYCEAKDIYKTMKRNKSLSDFDDYKETYLEGVLSLARCIADKFNIETNGSDAYKLIDILTPNYVISYTGSYHKVLNSIKYLEEDHSDKDFKEEMIKIKQTLKAYKEMISDYNNLSITLDDPYR